MLNARLRPGGPWMSALLACAVGATLAAGFLVVARTQMTSQRYELTRLREREAALRASVGRLRVEVAVLRSPQYIRPRAQALGLIQPGPGQVIPLPPDAAGAEP
jgi:cell division protein FtsB